MVGGRPSLFWCGLGTSKLWWRVEVGHGLPLVIKSTWVITTRSNYPNILIARTACLIILFPS